MYNNKVVEHFLKPRNAGSIPDADGIGYAGT
jgi:nitrogen fixation NifU-like protein